MTYESIGVSITHNSVYSFVLWFTKIRTEPAAFLKYHVSYLVGRNS